MSTDLARPNWLERGGLGLSMFSAQNVDRKKVEDIPIVLGWGIDWIPHPEIL